jgi:glutaredoxin 2
VSTANARTFWQAKKKKINKFWDLNLHRLSTSTKAIKQKLTAVDAPTIKKLIWQFGILN